MSINYYFINSEKIDSQDDAYNSYLTMVLKEFGSEPASSIKKNITQSEDPILYNIYGFKCNSKYIKDKYSDIVGTDKTIAIDNSSIHIKNITKELYELLFPLIIYFSIFVGDDDIIKTIASVKLNFGSHVASTIKFNVFGLNEYNIVFECNSDYMTTTTNKVTKDIFINLNTSNNIIKRLDSSTIEIYNSSISHEEFVIQSNKIKIEKGYKNINTDKSREKEYTTLQLEIKIKLLQIQLNGYK